MQHRIHLVFILMAVLGVALIPPSPRLLACGVERWSVKTGTDADAGLVNTASTTPTTIATMVGWPAQADPPANNRIQPYETTIWVISATLVEYKLETDQDYHLVLHDAAGNSMVAEIPAPTCVGSGSPFAAGISNARSEFDAKYTPTTSFQTANIPVMVTGCGMFDYNHGQTGAAPNEIELHPVLDILFNTGGGTTGGTSATTGTTGGAQLLGNPGFESGNNPLPWIPSSGVIDSSNYEPAHSGSWKAWLCGYGVAHTDTLSQQISIPSTATTAALSFWLHIDTAETSTTIASDTLSVQIRSPAGAVLATLATYSNLNAAGGYSQKNFDLSAYKGQTIQIYLIGSEDSTNQTSFVVDDFALATDVGGGTTGGSTGGTTGGTTGATTGEITGGTTGGTTATTGTTTGGTQLLGNAGFENGSTNPAPWLATPEVIDSSNYEPAHSGAWKAWLCGYGTTHTDTLYQQVSIPSTVTTATLTFWLHIDTAETTTTTAYDTLKVEIRDSGGAVLGTLATYSNLDAAGGYNQKTFDLSAYKGQTIQVYLIGSEDSIKQTSFVVDDFALNTQ